MDPPREQKMYNVRYKGCGRSVPSQSPDEEITKYILASKEINIHTPYTDLPSENGPDREQPPFSFSLIGDLHSPPY